MRSEKLSGDDPEADRCSERLEISTQRLVFKGACALFAKPSAGGKVTKSAVKPESNGTWYACFGACPPAINPDRCCRWELPGCAGHGFFWTATSSLAHKAVIRSNFSFAVASNDGLFHLSLNGKGVFCIEGRCAKEELVEISAQ